MTHARAGILAVAVASAAGTVLPAGGQDAWVDLGAVPAAAAQSTAFGREIGVLEAHAGKVFVGFGDWISNTGPIAITSWDGDSFDVEFECETEAVRQMRVIDGDLWVPAIDPRGGAPDHWCRLSAGVWSSGAFGADDALHVFDVVGVGGSVFAVGAVNVAGFPASVWESDDDGVTWARTLDVAAVAPGDFARFYAALVVGGEVWVEALDGTVGSQSTARVWNGAAWRSEPGYLPAAWSSGWKSRSWGADALALAAEGTNLCRFDGTGELESVLPSAVDYAVIDRAGADVVVAMTSSGRLVSSSDLRSWTTLGRIPKQAKRLAAVEVDGVVSVYVGTATSRLWQLDVTIPS